MFRRDPRRPPAATWPRHKVLALLTAALVLLVALLGGLVFAIAQAAQPTYAQRTVGTDIGAAHPSIVTDRAAVSVDAPAAVTGDAAERDALANRPMPVLDDASALPGPVSTKDPGVPLLLPPGTRIGPADVPTGFPRTPEGAMAQLAAIDQTALQSGSMAGVRAVIAEWAMAGGPTTSNWSGVRAMAAFLEAAGLSGSGSPTLAVVVTPMMGQVKGQVGTDWVVPCVLFEFAVTVDKTARVAVADCQRMVWVAGQWRIGPGPEPAAPPVAWPGTDAAIAAGYRDLHG